MPWLATEFPMHKITFVHARRIFLATAALLGLFLLTGCDITVTNLTSGSLPENPSQIYTISLRVHPTSSAVIKSSILPRIIIDGQGFELHKSALGDDIYDFDYQLPAGRDEAAYYFTVNYKYDNNGAPVSQEIYTDVFHLKIIKRQVLTLEAGRGPVGARLSVLGRGFTPQDVVYFGDTPAKTIYNSPSALSFIVPGVEANKNYPVTIGGATGNQNAGTFRVDPGSVQINPMALNLRTGEKQSLSFSVPNQAPPGGLLLDVTTDVPESVIMPEVVIPAGSSTVTITVEGGKPGSGALYLKGYGTGEISIPVTVVK